MSDSGYRSIGPGGEVICTERGLLELLYRGKDIGGLSCDDARTVEEWEAAARICDYQLPGPRMHGDAATADPRAWITPEPWASIDLHAWCMERCRDQQEVRRAMAELEEFDRRGMIPVMRHMIYCADTWRENGIFWGVGRGSSVSSFVLYLIGINRINPLEHDLDLGEWLK